MDIDTSNSTFVMYKSTLCIKFNNIKGRKNELPVALNVYATDEYAHSYSLISTFVGRLY